MNKLIDIGFEDNNKAMDLVLHFFNEAVIHQNPRLWARNFIHYEIEPRLGGRRYGRRRKAK
ncbi:hypothetical protein SPV2_gp33 [Sulfolobus polyhedral virus 2]|uniref:Uncharacterized protein n=1 Tax=Sulfolobus polyhedral virus 2 TaxID=2493125 RepID=A0A3S8NFN1_9VIRU|nr:hypothetical protein KM458_gp33 [Sulfolobus polyhedral virus 2]AZI76032.1 hypothetical protein SPV2_gp33 [Sulfolobus polyhedral virus 2]